MEKATEISTKALTISRMESFGRKTVGGHVNTIDAILRVLAQRGVEIEGNDTVRLVKKPRR